MLKKMGQVWDKGLDIVLTQCVDRNVIVTRLDRTFLGIYDIAKLSGIGYLLCTEKGAAFGQIGLFSNGRSGPMVQFLRSRTASFSRPQTRQMGDPRLFSCV